MFQLDNDNHKYVFYTFPFDSVNTKEYKSKERSSESLSSDYPLKCENEMAKRTTAHCSSVVICILETINKLAVITVN